MSGEATVSETVITPQELLDHWQGHRRLTRRLIDAFPDDQLFAFRVEPMRPFGLIAMEIVSMAAPMARALATGESGPARHHDASWVQAVTRHARPKAELLRLWDESTEQIDALWSQIPPGRFRETITVFGQFTGVASGLLLYVIDNEIHHRGQGYVYLRHLGIDTPRFYVR